MDFNNMPYDPTLRFGRPEKTKERENTILAKALEQPHLGFDTIESAKLAMAKFHPEVCEFFFRNGYGTQLSVDGYYAVFDEIVWHHWFLDEQYPEHFVRQIPAKERLTEPPWSDDYIGYWWRNLKRIPGVLVLQGQDYIYIPHHHKTAPAVSQTDPHREDHDTTLAKTTDSTAQPFRTTDTGTNPAEKTGHNATEATGVTGKDGGEAIAKRGGMKKKNPAKSAGRVSKPRQRKGKEKKVGPLRDDHMRSNAHPRTRAGRRARVGQSQSGQGNDGAAAEEESFLRLPDDFKEPKSPEDPDKD